MGINYKEAIKYLLFKEYEKEFEIVDGIRQHKDGLSYVDWLERKGLAEEHTLLKTKN